MPGGSGSRLDRGQRLGWLTLVLIAFASGFGAAAVWLGPQASADEVPRAVMATATLLPVTQRPPSTPTPSLLEIDSSLPSLYIDIAPPEMAKIEAKRDEALPNWILQTGPEDFVDASLHLGQQPPIPVRLRLKGDWGDHFSGDKWSYRIEIQGDAALWGMTVFSFQDPSTRSFLNEWLFTENLRDEGVLAVRYNFVNGVQNGVALGVYALEESFSKELVESQGRREGVIIRYDEDLLWSYRVAFENDLSTPRGVRRFHIIDEFGSGDVNADPVLSAQRDIAAGKLRAWWAGELPASEVYDVETTARFWALADLWGAQHALIWHNLRFYYNPVTTLLEPIGYDAQPLGAGELVDAETLAGRLQALAYGDPRLQRAYVHALWEFSRPEYLDAFERTYAADLDGLRAALTPEFGDLQTPDGVNVLAPPWDVLRKRQAALRELLTPLQMTYAYRPAEAPPGVLWLDVGNLTGFPVSIVGLQVEDLVIPAERDWLAPETEFRALDASVSGDDLILRPLAPDATFIPYTRLWVPDDAVGAVPPEADVRLLTRVWGLTQTVTQPVPAAYPSPTTGPLPPAPGLDDVLARHSYLHVRAGEEHILTIAPGISIITGSVVLPEGYGLALDAGTTLRFAPETFLLARGPLSFQGTVESPVVLEPSDAVWRGIVVLDSDRPSDWDYVTVRDTDAVDLDGWSLTGGLTFYQSPVSLGHVRILGTLAEDAVNVIRSEFVFANTEFADTASDAFDVDFSQGEILDSLFRNIGADGIDTSGSQVSVRNVRLQALGDKGISAGESSRLTADEVTVVGADFGIVGKDLSQVEVRTLSVSDIRIAALAAYTKKASYGPATVTVTGLTADGVMPDRLTLVQTGSWIDLEGERVWGSDVDIDALYRR